MLKMNFEQELKRCLIAHEDSIIDDERIDLLMDDIMEIFHRKTDELLQSQENIRIS